MGSELGQGPHEALHSVVSKIEAGQRQSRDDGLDGARAVPRGGAAVGSLADDVGDWDTLFDAVKSRLRLIVEGSQGSTSGAAVNAAAAHVQAGVLECVAALDQLHAAWRHAMGLGTPPDRVVNGSVDAPADVP